MSAIQIDHMHAWRVFFRIEENYEVCKGSHVARETVYSQYCHFCQTRGHVAVNSASFGKAS